MKKKGSMADKNCKSITDTGSENDRLAPTVREEPTVTHKRSASKLFTLKEKRSRFENENSIRWNENRNLTMSGSALTTSTGLGQDENAEIKYEEVILDNSVDENGVDLSGNNMDIKKEEKVILDIGTSENDVGLSGVGNLDNPDRPIKYEKEAVFPDFGIDGKNSNLTCGDMDIKHEEKVILDIGANENGVSSSYVNNLDNPIKYEKEAFPDVCTDGKNSNLTCGDIMDIKKEEKVILDIGANENGVSSSYVNNMDKPFKYEKEAIFADISANENNSRLSCGGSLEVKYEKSISKVCISKNNVGLSDDGKCESKYEQITDVLGPQNPNDVLDEVEIHNTEPTCKDTYPGILRISNVELVPITDEDYQPSLEIETVDQHQNINYGEKKQQDSQDTHNALKKVNLLLQYCRNREQREDLLNEKNRLEKMLNSGRNAYGSKNDLTEHTIIVYKNTNGTKTLNMNKINVLDTSRANTMNTNRRSILKRSVPPPNKDQLLKTPAKIIKPLKNNGLNKSVSTSEPSDDVFVVFHNEPIDEDEDEVTASSNFVSICSCTMDNMSEVELRLKHELKRLREMSQSAHDLQKRRLESKISQLNDHLCQPHICDNRIPGTKCNWCGNPENKSAKQNGPSMHCESVKLKRQLERLELLFSIHKDKGEDEKWLLFKIAETKRHLDELKICCGRAKETNNSNTTGSQPANLNHKFNCACSICNKEHSIILRQLGNLCRELKKGQ